MAVNPKNLGAVVSTRPYSWSDLCVRSWGSEWAQPDHNTYEFSGGHNKDSTDRGLTGIYGVAGDTLLLIDGSQYPDMRDGLVAGVGIAAGSANAGLGSYQEIDADPRI